jgi:hypothetical protein
MLAAMETYTILIEGQAVVCPIHELQEFSIFAQFLEEAATDDSASDQFIIPLGAITYKAFSAIRQILTHFNGNPPFPGIHPYLEEQGWTPDSLVEAADYLGHPKLATVLAAAILSGLQHLTADDLTNLATGDGSVSEALASVRLQNVRDGFVRGWFCLMPAVCTVSAACQCSEKQEKQLGGDHHQHDALLYSK